MSDQHSPEPWQEADRLHACVTACQGVPTEWLENHRLALTGDGFLMAILSDSIEPQTTTEGANEQRQ